MGGVAGMGEKAGVAWLVEGDGGVGRDGVITWRGVWAPGARQAFVLSCWMTCLTRTLSVREQCGHRRQSVEYYDKYIVNLQFHERKSML